MELKINKGEDFASALKTVIDFMQKNIDISFRLKEDLKLETETHSSRQDIFELWKWYLHFHKTLLKEHKGNVSNFKKHIDGVSEGIYPVDWIDYYTKRYNDSLYEMQRCQKFITLLESLNAEIENGNGKAEFVNHKAEGSDCDMVILFRHVGEYTGYFVYYADERHFSEKCLVSGMPEWYSGKDDYNENNNK